MNIVTDAEIRQIAQQLAVTNRQLIIEEIDRRFRTPTGVDSGGPFNTFSVNDQGQVIAASNFYARASISTPVTGITSTSHRIDYDTIDSDVSGAIVTGASWVCNLDAGKYVVFASLGFKPVNTIGLAEYFDIVLYNDTSSAQIDVITRLFLFLTITTSTALNSSNWLLSGMLPFQLTTPAAIRLNWNRPTSAARDILGGTVVIKQVG